MKNQVIHGDCLIEMQQIPDKSIDMILTSPPYDNLREYNGYSFDFEGIAQQIFRVLKEGGVCVWIVGDATLKGSETGTSFKQALYFKEIGFNLHDTMVWLKDTTAFPTPVRYYQAFEYMFILSKGKPKTFNPINDRKNKYGGTSVHGTDRNTDGSTVFKSAIRNNLNKVIKDYGSRFNYWFQSTEKNSKELKHPATFPEKLAEDHILSWSNQGDIVLDPLAGSGTTLKMAKKNGRNYIGIEISKEYIDIINKRLTLHPLE